MNKYRTQADGSVVCPHRDLSVCPPCLAADPNLVDVVGAVFLIPLGPERDAFDALRLDDLLDGEVTR
jgi:hypothetical protein